MADTKVSALTAATEATAADLLYLVDEAATSKKITHANYEASILHANIVPGDGSDHSDVAANTAHAATVTGNPHVVLLDELGNPSGNATFTMATKSIIYNFTAPTSADGAFEINISGGFTGDALHIHQHTGNPGATNLIHLEATDADVVPLRIDGAGTYDIISGDVSFGSITTSGTVDGRNIDTDGTKLDGVEANADVTDATNVISSLSGGTLTGALTAADHGTAATDEIVNVSYGTGSPPTANTTTIGSLFIQYTA